MSADEVFDPAEFEGITDVDVYVVLKKYGRTEKDPEFLTVYLKSEEKWKKLS